MKTVGNRNRNPELRSQIDQTQKGLVLVATTQHTMAAEGAAAAAAMEVEEGTGHAARGPGRPTKARCPGRPWTGTGSRSTWNRQQVLAGEQTWPEDAPIKPCTGKAKRCSTCNYCAHHCMCTQSAQKRQRDASDELHGRRVLQYRDAAEDAEDSISHILGDGDEDISRRLSFSATSAAADERPKLGGLHGAPLWI